MGITRQEILNARLRDYLHAEQMVLRGQAYSVSGRSLTRADLAQIRKAIDELLAQGAVIEGEPPKPGRVRKVVFEDW